jgi:hypothetical protein
MQDHETTTEINDACPIWAKEMISQLRQVEIYLGNVPKTLSWKSEHLNEVTQKIFSEDAPIFDENKAHWIYKRIATGLSKENFSPEQIAQFFNRRIGYDGGPQYTNHQEVQEVLT